MAAHWAPHVVNIKWKTTDVDLPAVVLPRAGFDLLLGLTWIINAGVGLDAERQVLVHQGQEYPFETMSVPEPPKGVVTTVIYAGEHFLPSAPNGDRGAAADTL